MDFRYDVVGLGRPPLLSTLFFGASFLEPITAVVALFTPLVFNPFDPTATPAARISFFDASYVLTAPTFLGMVFDTPTRPTDWLAFEGAVDMAFLPGTAVRLNDFTVQNVPEPATWGLLLLGLGALWGSRARRVRSPGIQMRD